MMASITAREYKEWEAYERAVGPIDAQYEREMIVALTELLQVNNLLTGAQVTKKGRKNPAGKFKRMPRPHQYFDPDWEDGDPDEEEEFDEDDIDYGLDDEEEEPPPKKGEGDGGYDPAKDPFANWEQ